jgi:histidinol dehydrogenase
LENVVLARIDLRGDRQADLAKVLPRARLDVETAIEAVRPVCDAVRDRGRAAVLELTERFDGVRLDDLRVPEQALREALTSLDPSVRGALEEAIARARLVHEAQRRDDAVTQVSPGATVTERWVPVGRVGLYVPGGLVAYPSSVVMNVVPAQVAGVPSLAVSSPPKKDFGGRPNPAVLAACALLGVDEVYAVGGAQAVAMFAFGVEDVPAVDLVTGPGNVYVAAAKRLVRGVVGIDAEAGPTEIAILADDSADPAYVAADLIAQAEHDEQARAILVTPNRRLAATVVREIGRQMPATGPARTALARNGAIVVTRTLDDAIALSERMAPEHVVCDTATVAARLRRAGTVFVGDWSAQASGDYVTGSNHVLPTSGAAAARGGLSASDFVRVSTVQRLTRTGLHGIARDGIALAEAEGLSGHAASIRIRLQGKR